MITIHHNFDEKKFMWLWARYVKSGNIEKHCVNSIPGLYSKMFSGASNKDLQEQPILEMDEVPYGTYQAIYFCGVLKTGYLNKDPMKNNYRHNVHFVVRPVDGGHDVYDFENWHVDIDGGVLERIPATYELKEKFFTEAPYTSHYYTCRIFRWMVGHFFPDELQKFESTNEKLKAEKIIEEGFDCAKGIFENETDNSIWMSMVDRLEKTGTRVIGNNKCSRVRKLIFNRELTNREEIRAIILKLCSDKINASNEKYFRIGIEEYLENTITYEDRKFISIE